MESYGVRSVFVLLQSAWWRRVQQSPPDSILLNEVLQCIYASSGDVPLGFCFGTVTNIIALNIFIRM